MLLSWSVLSVNTLWIGALLSVYYAGVYWCRNLAVFVISAIMMASSTNVAISDPLSLTKSIVGALRLKGMSKEISLLLNVALGALVNKSKNDKFLNEELVSYVRVMYHINHF